MKISIIIPVYNEEKTLSEIIKKVRSVKLSKIKKEVIIINDGSTDKTLDILKKLKYKNCQIIHFKKNQGKGAAVRSGFKKASGDLFLIQDADLEYNPNDYMSLINPIKSGKSQVVYGTRLLKYPLVLTGQKKTPLPLHWIANKSLTWLTNFLYDASITDMETCYKLFTRQVLKEIKLKSNRFEIEPEITAKILKKGYKIYEVPIKVKPRTKKEGKKIGWKDGFMAIWTLFKYRFTD